MDQRLAMIEALLAQKEIQTQKSANLSDDEEIKVNEVKESNEVNDAIEDEEASEAKEASEVDEVEDKEDKEVIAS